MRQLLCDSCCQMQLAAGLSLIGHNSSSVYKQHLSVKAPPLLKLVVFCLFLH